MGVEVLLAVPSNLLVTQVPLSSFFLALYDVSSLSFTQLSGFIQLIIIHTFCMPLSADRRLMGG
jgi:hypothetical protein